MSGLDITNTAINDGGTVRITLAGRLAIDTVQDLHSFLLETTDSASAFQVDVSGITSVDLAGIQIICSACRTALETKKRFNFSGNLSDEVKKAIGDVGLQRMTTCRHNCNQPCIWCGGIN